MSAYSRDLLSILEHTPWPLGCPPRSYAGVGPEWTPREILLQMELIAGRLAGSGWVLRTGDAPGADAAFTRGCRNAGGVIEIFRPVKIRKALWEKFVAVSGVDPEWADADPTACRMLFRDCQQVLGKNLDNPVSSVICWDDGGLGHAVVIAERHDVPVINLREFL